MEDDSSGFADYIGDAVFFLICVAFAVAAVYLLVPIFQPDLWRVM